MKLLLLGAKGMLGWELRRTLTPLGKIIACDRSTLDLSSEPQLENFLQDIQVDVIVNAAAYTAVDKAESEPDLAEQINHRVVKALAETALRNQALFIHYSTDYVFDGSKQTAYCETDQPNPLNVYGKSKLAGEQAILDSGADALIFRTSWVYAARGNNFLRTIRRLACQRETLNIVADQQGAPTWARMIAETTGHCLQQAMAERAGQRFRTALYHLTSRGTASWFDFAQAIIAGMQDDQGLKLRDIIAIPSSDYPTPAARPLNSRLDSQRLEQHFDLIMPHWQDMLELCLADIDQCGEDYG